LRESGTNDKTDVRMPAGHNASLGREIEAYQEERKANQGPMEAYLEKATREDED
jgi:hypothetical protein